MHEQQGMINALLEAIRLQYKVINSLEVSSSKKLLKGKRAIIVNVLSSLGFKEKKEGITTEQILKRGFGKKAATEKTIRRIVAQLVGEGLIIQSDPSKLRYRKFTIPVAAGDE